MARKRCHRGAVGALAACCVLFMVQRAAALELKDFDFDPTPATDLRVREGPKLKRLDSGAVTTEANLNIGEAHVYNRHRFSRNDWQNIKYVWNVMEIEVVEKTESCKLDVLVTEGQDTNYTNHGYRLAANRTTYLDLSPFGDDYVITVQCQKSRLGLPKGAWYQISVNNVYHPKYPALIAIGAAMLLLAPVVSRSVRAFYAGGMLLSFMLLSLVILFQITKRVPGGSKLSGLFLVFYSVMPTDWRDVSTNLYLGTLTWPFREVWAYLQNPEGFDEEKYLSLGLAVLWLWVSVTVGFFSVRWLAINRDTGGVDSGAREFVLWTTRVLALLGPLFNGASRDHQIRVAITLVVGGSLVPPGSYLVALVLRIPWLLLYVVTYPLRVVLRGLGWGRKPKGARACGSLGGGGGGGDGDGAEGYVTPVRNPRTLFGGALSTGKKSAAAAAYADSPMRRDGSQMDDPSASTSATPVSRKPPAAWAAAAKGRFLTPVEAHKQMQMTTNAQVAALVQSPQFQEWARKSHGRVRMDDHEDDVSEEEDSDDDVAGVSRRYY